MPRRVKPEPYFLLPVIWILLSLTGCVNIKPVSTRSLQEYIREHHEFWEFAGEQSGVRIRCSFALSQDRNLYFFDADLYDAGVVPVFVQIENSRRDSVRWKWPHIEIKTDHWRLAPIGLDEMREAVFRKYEINSYTESDLETFDTSFSELMMAGFSLEAGETKTGVIYFEGGRFHPGVMESAMLVMGNVQIGDRKVKLVFRLHRL